ncbi:hypothetical protein PR048_016876 [Dryococelus australis]|uniref:Uncharacterized protein n=1 Tax=Dryococelus australis TaxID=614101 RepID=A0ABQ9H815_9NEOP|nr:hypothetical protein PR048_016876 [Dryococelus australis]
MFLSCRIWRIDIWKYNLKLASDRFNRVLRLLERVEDDTSQVELFNTHCRDLEKLKIYFKENYITLSVKCDHRKVQQDQRQSGLTLSCSIKLPRYHIPKFHAQATQWKGYDLFTSLVHSNSSLSSVENTKTYVYQFSAITSNSPQKLRKLLDTVNENLGALKIMKFPVDKWRFVMLNLMFIKLDPDTHEHFELAPATCKALITATQLSNTIAKSKINYRKITETRDAQYSWRILLGTMRAGQKHKLHFNSLKGRQAKNCSSKSLWLHCGQYHHSLLHAQPPIEIRQIHQHT